MNKRLISALAAYATLALLAGFTLDGTLRYAIWILMAGLALFTLSLWSFTPITHDWGWRELLLPQGLRGFAQQFAVAPTVTGLPVGFCRRSM